MRRPQHPTQLREDAFMRVGWLTMEGPSLSHIGMRTTQGLDPKTTLCGKDVGPVRPVAVGIRLTLGRDTCTTCQERFSHLVQKK
jgi:hypothetical protein